MGLLFGLARRIILPLFAGQMGGTFLVLVMRPDVAFQHGNLLLLTVEGEFVVKNLVLLSAGLLVLGCRQHRLVASGTGNPVRRFRRRSLRRPSLRRPSPGGVAAAMHAGPQPGAAIDA